MDDQDSDYRVGYARPPLHSRFQKGHSGNKRGRPQGKLDISSALLKALNKLVVVNENGVRKKLRVFEVAIHQQAKKAAAGDANALKILITLMKEAFEPGQAGSPITIVISEADSRL